MSRPVFYDDSGTRAAAIQWTGRASILLGALVCLALTATLGAHVPLPSLERLNPFAALSQRSDASRNADQPDAFEPRPTHETADRVGTERALAITPHGTSPTDKVAKLDDQRSAAIRSGANAKVVGSPPSKPPSESGRTIDAAPPGQPAVTAPRTQPRRAHADRGKSNQAKSADHSAKPSTHPASRVAAAKSKPGAQARTRSGKAAETSSPSKRKPAPGKAKP